MATKSKHTARRPRRRGRRILLILVLTFLGLTVGAGVAGWMILSPYMGERMDMTLLELPAVNRPAVLYARDPALRAEREGDLYLAPSSAVAPLEKRIFVPYEEMPADLIHAFVAIEDKRFYDHHGVDLWRTARAAGGYLTGNASFGGSTITQQLVKNLTGHDEPTADRKLREIFLALDLERNADKKTVLECYLNIINLAEGCRGVGAAAKRYYSKSVSELTLAECATIAAITQNPARYDPLRHPEAARMRRDLILHEMADQGYITSEIRDAAVSADLGLHPGSLTEEEAKSKDGIASWYTDLVAADVIRDLCAYLGYTRARASDLFYTGGITVETAMDRDLQALVEAYYTDLSHFPQGPDGRPQSSFILLDPYTGDILAVAGAVGEKRGNRLQNYATDTLRPAGSCIKPLSLFAPAVEEGRITWATLLEDAPISEKNGIPWPRNADGLYRGKITAGVAMAESVNTVAVRLLETVGSDRALAYLRDRFALRTLQGPDETGVHDATVSSLALGQQSRGVTSRELTAAYTAFFGGIYRTPVSYHRVLDKDGNVLLENPRTAGKQVLAPSTAALLTRMLESVTDHGTAAKYLAHIKELGVATAGKTGTTQNNCDRRFVGYTPRLLAGVWMGYDYPSELRGIPGNPCVGIWDDLMTACEKIYRGSPPDATFDTPGLVEVEICPFSGERLTSDCRESISGDGERAWFIPGTEPYEACPLHEEPPIQTIPEDPNDPERIPLLPGTVLPDESAPNTDRPPSGPIEPNNDTPWYSRWFQRFSRRNPS